MGKVVMGAHVVEYDNGDVRYRPHISIDMTPTETLSFNCDRVFMTVEAAETFMHAVYEALCLLPKKNVTFYKDNLPTHQ